MGRASPSHDAARGRPAPAPRGGPPGPGRPRRRIGPDGDGEPVRTPGPPRHSARAARGRRRARHPGRPRRPPPPGSARGQGRRRVHEPSRPGGLRTGPLERPHLAQAAGRRRPGQGHGRHDTAEPAARRRPTGGAGADVCRVGPSARPARRPRARRRTCAALPAGRRRGRGSGRRGRPRARWRCMSAHLWGEARFGVPGRGSDNEQYVRPLGTADEGAYAVAITPSTTSHVAGWEHTRLRVAVCGEGEYADHDSHDEETLVVPLAGSFRVEVTEADGTTYDVTLVGRGSVFDGPTDALYAGRG